MPRYSLADQVKIKQLMEDGAILPMVTDDFRRRIVLQRLLQHDGRIPSLHLFAEDTIYLEPAAKILTNLVHPRKKKSIRNCMLRCYVASLPSGTVVEVDEGVYRNIDADERTVLELAYRQLWLFAIRHYPEMTQKTPRKDPRNSKDCFAVSEDMPVRLALLAYRLGFRTDTINKLYDQDPTKALINAFLARARPKPRFASPSPTAVQRIFEEVDRIQHNQVDGPSPVLSQDREDQPIGLRSGRPSLASFKGDNGHLFATYMYANEDFEVREYPSSFAVKRDIFFSFFGQSQNISTALSRVGSSTNDATSPPSGGMVGDEVVGAEGVSQRGTIHNGPLRMLRMRSRIGQAPLDAVSHGAPSSVYSTGSSSSNGAEVTYVPNRASNSSTDSSSPFLSNADLIDSGLSPVLGSGPFRILGNQDQIRRLVRTIYTSSTAFIYILEAGEFFLANFDSDRLEKTIDSLTKEHVFFGQREEEIVFLDSRESIAFAKAHHFLFAQRRQSIEDEYVQPRNEILQELEVLWKIFCEIDTLLPNTPSFLRDCRLGTYVSSSSTTAQ